MFHVVFKLSASKDLQRLPRQVQVRFSRTIPALEGDPLRRRPGLDTLAMEGMPAVYRMRIGHYRAIYEVDGDLVRMLRFGHRSTVYR